MKTNYAKLWQEASKQVKKPIRKKAKRIKKVLMTLIIIIACLLLFGGFAYCNEMDKLPFKIPGLGLPEISLPEVHFKWPWEKEEKVTTSEVKAEETKQTEAKAPEQTLEETRQITVNGTPMTVKQCLMGALAYEMPDSYPIEALKAQAIAIRTNVYRNIRSGSLEMDIPYQDTTSEAIKKAVEETEQVVVLQNGEPIQMFYHGNTGGTTLTAAEAGIEGDFPYLKKMTVLGEDNIEKFDRNVQREIAFTPDEFRAAVGDKAGSFEIDKGDICVADADGDGRVKAFRIGGYTFSPKEINEMLGLNSYTFTVEFKDSKIVFICKGMGIPVGLSGNGAKILAEENGKNATDIIQYYYDNVSIEKIDFLSLFT